MLKKRVMGNMHIWETRKEIQGTDGVVLVDVQLQLKNQYAIHIGLFKYLLNNHLNLINFFKMFYLYKT